MFLLVNKLTDKSMIVLNRFNSLSLERRSAIVFVLATAISSGIHMLTTPLFTRLMPVDSFGVVQLYNTWYQVIWVFATFSVTNAVVNVGFHDYPADRIGFLSSSLGISTFCTILITLFILLIKPWFEVISGLNTSLILLMAISFLFLNSTQLWICLNRYELKYKLVFCVMTLSGVFSSLLSLLFVYNTNHDYAETRLWSQNAIPILIGIIIYIYIVIKGKKFYNKKYWLFILFFNAPLLIHYLSQFVLSSSDRLMINFFCSESDVAIYSLAYLVSNILMVFFSPINSVIIPRTHKLMDDHNYKEVANFLYKLLFLIGAIILCISLFSPEIILVLGGKQYNAGIKIVPIVSASTLFTVLYLYVANIEFLYGKTTRIAIMTIIAAVSNVVLNAIFIPVFGFVAAAYTTLFAYIIYAWLHIRNMTKLVGNRIFSNMKLFVICTIITVACSLSVLISDINWLRYIIMTMILVVCIANIKSVNKIIR